IDIGFGRIVVDDPAIERKIVATESLIVAVPQGSPLGEHKALTPDDIGREPFIVYPAKPRPSYADHVLSLFAAAGYGLKVVHEANELQTALGLVAAGLGVTVVPATVQRLHRDDVVYVPLAAPGFTSPIIMSYRRDDQSPYLHK